MEKFRQFLADRLYRLAEWIEPAIEVDVNRYDDHYDDAFLNIEATPMHIGEPRPIKDIKFK